jgi:peroxiredoxin
MESMTARHWMAGIALAVVAVVAGISAQQWLAARNMPAPDASFTDLQGQPHKVSDYRGKWLLINFWATWCAPCIHEIPLLVKAQSAHASRGLQIVGPAMDQPEAVREMMEKLEVNYPVFVGDAQVSAAMEALGNEMGVLPYTVLIGTDGKVLERLAGGLTQAKLDALLAKYLAP